MPFYEDKSQLMTYKDDTGSSRQILTLADWGIRRSHILANMRLVMGELPSGSSDIPVQWRLLEQENFGGIIRSKIEYFIERDGDWVPAYLLMPKAADTKTPAMLCLHQTTAIGKGEPAGLRGLPNLHYAYELAERGYVALAPDYPNFGDYQCNPYALGYASATMKGIVNHRRAIDLLQSLPQVDGERIGCIGHSLGGHNTLFVAAFDERIKAMVSSCGFNSYRYYYNGNLTGWSHKGYMPRIADIYDKDPTKLPFDFTEIVAALAPRPLFINAPLEDSNFAVAGVYACREAALPVYKLFDAASNLYFTHPSAGHDFPPEVRNEAYSFLGRVLAK